MPGWGQNCAPVRGRSGEPIDSTTCKVHHGSGPMLAYCVIKSLFVKQIADLDRTLFHGPSVARAEIVVGDGIDAFLTQGLEGVGSDVSGTTSYEHSSVLVRITHEYVPRWDEAEIQLVFSNLRRCVSSSRPTSLLRRPAARTIADA